LIFKILDRDNFLQIIEANGIYLRGLAGKREEDNKVHELRPEKGNLNILALFVLTISDRPREKFDDGLEQRVAQIGHVPRTTTRPPRTPAT
jgi:hypothetical protein